MRLHRFTELLRLVARNDRRRIGLPNCSRMNITSLYYRAETKRAIVLITPIRFTVFRQIPQSENPVARYLT